MNTNQPQDIPVAPAKTRAAQMIENAVYVLCAVFLVSFIAEAGYWSFTRTVPAWLLWTQVGLLTVLIGLGIFDMWGGRLPMSKTERWYNLILMVFFLISLYWVMLLASVKPIDKIWYPGLVFVLGNHFGRWLFARLGRQTGEQKV